MKENRIMGFVLVCGVWGLLVLLGVINIVKHLIDGEPQNIGLIVGTIAGVATIITMFLGDKVRRIAAMVWLVITVVSLLLLVIGAGLEIKIDSYSPMFIGLITFSLMTLPDRN